MYIYTLVRMRMQVYKCVRVCVFAYVCVIM